MNESHHYHPESTPGPSEWRNLNPRSAAERIRNAIQAAPPKAKAAAFAEIEDTEGLEARFSEVEEEAGPERPSPQDTAPRGVAANIWDSGLKSRELYKIPYMLKDLFNLAGRVTRAGATFLQEAHGPAKEDSLLVRRLREAGAVFAGKTNLNEFAYGLDGMNAHYGNCPHPWDSARISGGSSSGSAWAVGRRVVPLAFGTDTGGSIRVPAALCGVYGVRMEPNELAVEGVIPLSETFDTVGWFTDSPEVSAAVWRTLADDREHATADPSRMIYVPRSAVVEDQEMAAHYRRAADRFELNSSGQSTDAVSVSEIAAWIDEHTDEHVAAYNIIGSSEAYAYHEPLLEQWGDRYEPRVRELIERGARWTEEDRAWARSVQAHTEGRLLEYLSAAEAIVMPTTHVTAPRFEEADQEYRRRILALTALGSLGRVPIVTVPVFVTDRLSGGLQFLVHPQRRSLVPAILHMVSRAAAS